MTSTSVGWVLLDGQGADAAILDHDAFDIEAGVNGSEGIASPHAAAARGAQRIATTSGHRVDCVRVTWTEDVDDNAAALLKSLAGLGFENVQAIALAKAAQTWGIEVGSKSEHAKTGLCILEPDTATIMVVATGAGTVRTAVTGSRESAEDLVEWLRSVFRKDDWLPESLYLIGAHDDLDEITAPIADALPIPVIDSVDTQLALARGAALTTTTAADSDSFQGAEAQAEKPWRVSRSKKPTSPVTEPAAAVSPVDTGTTRLIDAPRDEPEAHSPRHEPTWLVTHAKKLTIGAAAAAVLGAALSLAAGSALNVENASTQAADASTMGASVTSASVHTVPAPAPSSPATELQPLAAEPVPEAPPSPPEALSLPAASAAVLAPEAAALPAAAPTVPAIPTVAVPVAEPVTPPAAVPVASPAAPTPAAPVVVPVAAAPTPAAPPPAAAAFAAPVASAESAEPPPPGPIQQAFSPLFSGLP